ncbi:MAG: phosphoribosylformylglycinamidine synthase subunit PurQ, partial [Muribaculaceae bacterium]|nr:phosphoribosylformylglycinamidine synthase subunit PurQ [Muribaculaceae bacterium]
VVDVDRFKATFEAVQKLVGRNLLLAAHDVSAGGLVTTLLEMTFANTAGGLAIDTDAFVNAGEEDLIKILFAENPALVVQVADARLKTVTDILDRAGAVYRSLGAPIKERAVMVTHKGADRLLPIDHLRDVWMHTSFLMDSVQSGEACAEQRYHNYKRQPLKIAFAKEFDGKLATRGLTLDRHAPSGIKAAIIREKGVNGDREMAYSLYLAGFDVKDVHMTDLMSGRETLDDVNMIVFCGGFSNSDVLGSAKGWASGFKWNENASSALKRFYKREDTLSLGVCNGCQLMIELNLINPEHEKPTSMDHNISHKFESQFVSVNIPETNSVMLGSLAGSKLGIWVAHGEGRFKMPMPRDAYNVAMKYNYTTYPGNPNGSPSGVAALCSADGRHLAMMPHLERAIFPWQWAYYPAGKRHEVTPWVDAFINARCWIENKTKQK